MSTSFTNLAGLTAGDLPLPPMRMGKLEFLTWAMQSDLRAEWVDGEVTFMAPANRDHMETRRWFDSLLTMYVRRRQLGTVGDDMLLDLDEPIVIENDILRSRVIDGFWVRTAWLWRDSRPDEDVAYAEMSGKGN